MKPKEENNPFTPGTGHSPPLLAGRDEETRLLALMLDRLNGPRTAQAKLAKEPFPPIKIVGPRGVGKTVLLKWIQRRAAKLGIRAVVCERLKQDDPEGNTIEHLISDIAGGKDRLFRLIENLSLSVGKVVDIGVGLRQAGLKYNDIVRAVVQDQPLLLLLDEAHHYDLGPLATLLQKNQQLIAEGHPLGVIIAGTPGLDSHLDKAESTFIFRSEHVYIHTLSDAATRKALREPFRQADVDVAPDALEAMAAQTDNYPFFIQLVGQKVWDEVAQASREDVDVGMVRRIEEKARKSRDILYNRAWLRMYACDLLPYAHQVIELLDRNGGRVPEKAILDLLRKASGGQDGGQVMTLYEALREDGLIWTEDGETKPGMPSFFKYCKARDWDGSPSSGGGFRPRSWLPDFLPGFFLPKKRG